MRSLATTLAIAGVMAVPALAGTSATVTPLDGFTGDYWTNGVLEGYFFGGAPDQGPAAPALNLYDNVPTFLGGSATEGGFGPFHTAWGSWALLDWANEDAHFGEEVHSLAAGAGPVVITNIWYGYFNPTLTSTHVIRLYDMVPPSGTHGGVFGAFTPLTKGGSLLATVTITGLPIGAHIVTIPVSIALPQSSVWVKFQEQGPGNTFWLTGGSAGLGSPPGGYSHRGFTYTLPGDPPYPYNAFYASTYLQFHEYQYAVTQITMGLSGFVIPAPAVIGVFGAAGLVMLRRRRVR